jgi:hypothetical protein
MTSGWRLKVGRTEGAVIVSGPRQQISAVIYEDLGCKNQFDVARRHLLIYYKFITEESERSRGKSIMENEEKGFVIKDRRSFDDGGELKREEEPLEEKGPQESPAEAKRETLEAERERDEKTPLPEVNFNSLILSLSSSALLSLGEIPDPQSGEKRRDLPLAKHSIDIIAMLKEKTRGNLNDEEQKFVESVLTDLRWRYVKLTQ